LQEKEYSERLGSFTESRVSALREEVAMEKGRVDRMLEQQRAYSAAQKKKERLAEGLMDTVTAACRIFGGSAGGEVGEGFSVAALESALEELHAGDLEEMLDRAQREEVRRASTHLTDCRNLMQWATQSTSKILKLYKTKQPEDFAVAAAHAASMQEELRQSVHCAVLLETGEDSISKAWQVCETLLKKDAKDKAKARDKEEAAARQDEGVTEQKDGGDSSAAAPVDMERQPAHVRKALTQMAWLRGAVAQRNKNRSEGQSRELADLLQQCTDKIREVVELQSESRSTGALVTAIALIESNVAACMVAAKKNSSFTSPVQFILLEILTPLLDAVIKADSEELVMMLGHVCGALCRMTGRTGGELLQALLSSASSLAVPCVGVKVHVSGLPVAEGQEQQRRVVMLMACQMSSFDAPLAVDLSAGWSWLVRVGGLLHQQASSPALGLLCMCVRSFLRIAGVSLRQVYGKEFLSLLQTLLNTLPASDKSTPVVDLKQLLLQATKEGRIPSVLFRNQDAYGIYACTVVRCDACSYLRCELYLREINHFGCVVLCCAVQVSGARGSRRCSSRQRQRIGDDGSQKSTQGGKNRISFQHYWTRHPIADSRRRHVSATLVS
jgi:hypothetical protein